MRYAEYKVLCAGGPDGLAVQVCESIAEGWQPIGGVAVAYPSEDDCEYCQAVAKYA